jgi:hypothetical protein
MKYTFLKLGSGNRWGWWLVVNPSDTALIEELHRQVSIGMFKRFNANPHMDKAMLNKGPVELASRWLQTIEKFMAERLVVFVNENGGMFANKRARHVVDPICVVESETLRFPPTQESIARRKIDIHKWYGGTHYYLQCQDKLLFSKEKFNTIGEARFEAELYALPENIRLCASEFQYTHEGD